jgi:hypothetical protein
LGLAACGAGSSSGDGPPPTTPFPILFVTQVPVVGDFTTIGSTFGNHSASPASVARGGDLWIRYEDGTLRNLTEAAGFGERADFQGTNAIAVREPCVHWNGNKAVFSMVVGAPTSGNEGNFHWQLYEITGLAREDTPLITLVPFQPAQYNNVSPVYASDGRILFTSDRPRNGAAHLYPQLDEYEEAPTNTGIWSLDPTSGALFLMNHSASGSFRPLVDSFGRVVFTRWDHMERDQQADEDRMGFGNFQTFNYSNETAGAVDTGNDTEVFPEPRKQWIDYVNSHPGYSGDLADYAPHLVGNPFNHFLPWTLNQDGTEEETLNHVGRHELFNFFERARRDDFNVVDHLGFDPWVANRRAVTSVHQLREDPLRPGVFCGIDCREFDTHASGQVIAITGHPALNANEIIVTWVTHPDTQAPTTTPSANHSGLYRNPLPLSDGMIIASHTANTQKEANIGTPTAPRSRYDLRLKTLARGSNGFFSASRALTGGIRRRVQYFNPFTFVTYDGPLWELDPVEVRARAVPPATTEPALESPEQQALSAEGVSLSALRQYLRANNLALIVSRNVTARDRNDRQQPINLRIPGGVNTLANTGPAYDVAHFQIFQGDLIRGLHNGIFAARNGKRVLAQFLHEPAADNPPNPSGPPGSVALGLDGSMAALVPARRALSWRLTDPSGTPVVHERYWISLQPGEVRTCTNCHGLNETDQIGRTQPTNVPNALRTLLQHLKAQGQL